MKDLISRLRPNLLPKVEDKNWVTLEGGTHVFLDGGGDVVAGPPSLEGKPINRLSEGKEESEAPQSNGNHKKFSNKKEVSDYAKNLMEEQESALKKASPKSMGQLYALDQYQRTSDEINGALRSNKLNAELKSTVSNLDAAIKGSVLPDDLLLYRGIDKKNFNIKEGVYSDKAFLSTALDKDDAEHFVGDTGKGDKGVLLIINARKGTKGFCMGSTESEVVLPRNQKLKITKTEQDESGKITAYADVL